MDEHSELAQIKLKFEALEQRVKDLEDERSDAWWPEPKVADKVFVDMVRNIEPLSLQMLVRQTSISDWAKAAVTLPLDLLAKIRNNISAHVWGEFVYFAQEVDSHSTITSHRQAILRAARREDECGFLLVWWDKPPWPRKLLSALDPPGEPDVEAIAAGNRARQELKDWLEHTLKEAGRLPRQLYVDTSGIQV